MVKRRLTSHYRDRGPSLGERLADAVAHLRFSSGGYQRRLLRVVPSKCVSVPLDPIPGNEVRGQRLKGGRLYAVGYGRDMSEARLDAPEAPAAWRHWVNRWGWLRDLASVAPLSDAEMLRAGDLAQRWIGRFGRYDAQAWAPELTSQRLMMAISYAPMLCWGQNSGAKPALMQAIAQWAMHLASLLPRQSLSMAKASVAVALVGVSLVVPELKLSLVQAEKDLQHVLSELMPGEGWIVTRSPLDLARVGEWLQWLTEFYTSRDQLPPEFVVAALASVRTGLSAMAMGTGVPAPWHGGTPHIGQMERLGADAARDCKLPLESGFVRMGAGDVRIMVDAAPPPSSRISATAHASTFAMAVSDGKRGLVVNCGGERGLYGARDYTPDLTMGLRSTAGHSALVLADTNSSRIHVEGPRPLGGVEVVDVEYTDTTEGQLFEGRHDGWVRRFGYHHQRRLWLSADGYDIRGEDQLLPSEGRSPTPRRNKSLPVAIRFHLGPLVEPELGDDGRSVVLRWRHRDAPDKPGQGWLFRASFNHAPGVLAVEPSLLIDSQGQTQEIRQILLTSLLPSGKKGDISWSFRRLEDVD